MFIYLCLTSIITLLSYKYIKLYRIYNIILEEKNLYQKNYNVFYNDFYINLDKRNDLIECLSTIKKILLHYVANNKMDTYIYKNNVKEPSYIMEKILNNVFNIYYYQKNDKNDIIEWIDKSNNKIISINTYNYCLNRDNFINKLKKMI